ncbi:MAG: hypothetical protein IJH28_05375 [Mogibacterium sp.]|nr:hypothetical protein [Mogibacterium sp.]
MAKKKYRFAQPDTVEKKTRRIKSESWKKYTDNLKQLSDTASNKLKDYIVAGHAEQEILDYAYALVTKYGEASSALSCTMYEALAEYSGAAVKAAEPAAVASYWETAKQVRGTMLRTKDAAAISASAGRLVKLASVDTMMKNALRDGCEWAWIPAGDSCAFCTMLASRGWVKASEDLIANGHMSHIHSNCDCTFCVRHDKNVTVEGYDPDALYDEYINAGDTKWDRINGLRRKYYAANKDAINAQKRVAYAKRTEMAMLEEGHKGLNRNTEIARSIISSPDYSRRLSSVDTDRSISNKIISEARKMLNHRSGTLYEDLMFIDTRSGKFITRTDFDAKRKVMPSNRMKAMLREAPEFTIAAVHNHPGSTAPSPDDIHVLFTRRNAYGVVLCHDGTIYKYSINRKAFNEPAYSSVFAKLDKSDYNKNDIKTFISEAKDIGVIIERL